jgi:CDGSH-type Zn-finger protein
LNHPAQLEGIKMAERQSPRIKILKDGPYLVHGSVKLSEEIITSRLNDYQMKPGRTFQITGTYALCRCGQSKNKPFCDGSHVHHHFDGTETASRKLYRERAEIIDGPDLILADVEELCAFARFCQTNTGNAWDLTENSNDPVAREIAIRAASECPAGRLVAYNRTTKEAFEIHYDPSIAAIEDPDLDVSGPLWVRGGIPIESADGEVYEIRNRVTLCRCGKSRNKPFCDAGHVL